MRFTQAPKQFGEDLWAGDALDRKAQAEALVKLLLEVQAPATVTVEADYGQGKSFLVDRVAFLLRDHGEVVRLNAWTDNPFGLPGAAIAGALIDHLDQHGDTQPPAALDNLMREIVGLSPTRLFEGARLDVFPGVSISPGKEALWKPLRPSSVKSARDKIKTEIRSLHAILNPDSPPKIFCIVDDLDRCRPDQLVEFLESSRHIFDLENWVFVFAVSPDALQGSVESLFGINSVDAFLRRFIDLRFPLTTPKLSRYLTFLLSEDGERVAIDAPFQRSLALGIAMASQTWNQQRHVNLRDIDRAYQPLRYLLAATEDDPTVLRPLLMSLFFFKFFNHNLYEQSPRYIAQPTPNNDQFPAADGMHSMAALYRDLLAWGTPERPRALMRDNARASQKYTADKMALMDDAATWWEEKVGRALRGEHKVTEHHRAIIAAKLG